MCLYNIIKMTSRINKRWTVNELLALEREHELLEMDIFDIALKHKRTPRAILYKLEDEKINVKMLFFGIIKINIFCYAIL